MAKAGTSPRASKSKARRKPEKPSQIQVLTDLAIQLLRDAADTCQLRPSKSLDRDIITIQKRALSEGLSFFTTTLPSLGKCLDKALSSDTPVSFFGTAFRLSNRLPCFPVFMQEMWKLVFDKEGLVRDQLACNYRKQVAAVRAIRQVTFLAYKLEGSYGIAEETRILDNFVEVESLLPEADQQVDLSQSTRTALENARVLIYHVLKDFDPKDIRPKHGPGSVATGEAQWEKKFFHRLYENLEKEYPFTDYFFFNYSHLCDELDLLDSLEVEKESTAKVVLVEKDSRGPRIISMEPLEIQWIQQGLLSALVKNMTRADKPCSGYVNFDNQEVNRGLALEHSFYGTYCTYDMKEASDRVTVWLVKRLFPQKIVDALLAARSQWTVLPDGRRLFLKKFAPMGSAVCFPIEALTFWALAVGSLIDIRGRSTLQGLPKVWVYGDDIVASNSDYEVFRPVFEELFLEFNEDKCCTGRFFRESCGQDAFKFESVNPVRVRTPWSEKLSPEARLSYIAYVNGFSERGYVGTALFLQNLLTDQLGPIPLTNRKNHTGYYRYVEWANSDVRDWLLSTFRSRYNDDLQRTEVRLPTATAPRIERGSPDWAELLRISSMKGGPPRLPWLSDNEVVTPCLHTVPHQIKMRWSWVSLYSLLS
jgi:hypothetical protein